MKVLEANAGLLSNFEVLNLLRKRGAEKGYFGGSVTAGECKVYEYLVETPAGTQQQENVEEFILGARPFHLTDAEKLQTINLRPSTAVEVHLIVEDCDERLSTAQVDEFIGSVSEIIPAPPLKPGDEEEEQEEQEEQEAEEQEGEEAEEHEGEEDEGQGADQQVDEDMTEAGEATAAP